jgi:2-oxoglutarate ferredoxin oxidoreductase subunit delta
VKKFLKEAPVGLVTARGHRFTILRQFCKGCRICVEFCPTGTLDLDDRFKVKVANPDKCIGCLICERRCPDMAIFIEKSPKSQAPSPRQEAEVG